MRIVLIAALASFALAAPAMAQDTGATAPAKPKKEKRVCKKLDSTSGSHMTPVVCRTPTEWAERGNGQSVVGHTFSADDTPH